MIANNKKTEPKFRFKVFLFCRFDNRVGNLTFLFF